jgi:2-keto-4-pentenoate hydratase/2-oxohepta-3-ene-1,7-dioic acid hydratase in catechol pathway
MRLVRFGQPGQENPGIIDSSGAIRDLSGIVDDIDGTTVSPVALAKLSELDLDRLPIVDAGTRLGACIGNVRNLVCIGLNYSDHAAETDTPIPREPVVFNKHTGSISGPNDPVILPADAQKLDWEVELGVVIGRPGVYIAERDALDHVLGYCIGIDFSERDFQFNRGGQGFKGKSADTFAPLGPFLATRDEIADPQDLALQLGVNGKAKQSGSTRDMIFSVAELVSYISRFMSLQPGDVILTGTPAGVGLGQKPPVYLQAGDVVAASITGLGEQTHKVVAAG